MAKNKILAIVMSFVLVFTLMTTVSYDSQIEAAETFAITSPTDNQLIAAGYIDIEWSPATTSAVRDYQVYIDDKVVGTTTDTTYEYYTTKVKTFTAYVKARFTNGTSADTAKITFAVTKKGLGLSQDMGANVDLADMGCAWYYNWGITPSSGKQYKGIEFVPMIWGGSNAADIANKVNRFVDKGYKYVLAFNEPDLVGQANMTVDQAYGQWSGFMNDNILVGSPVTSTWPQASTHWFQTFMTKIDANKDYDVDFITIHCYPEDFAGAGMAEWFLREVVDWTWEKYHKPIWITEFSTQGKNVTESATEDFWKAVMPGLDEREYVERYAAFGFNYANNRYGLWNYNTGQLAKGGQVYRDYGNPEGYTAVGPIDPGYTVTQSIRTRLLPDSVTVKGIPCEDYVNVPGVTATASSRINNGSGADKAIDSDIGSRWESQQGVDPQSITVDLGEVRNIKQVDIIWEAASAENYTVQVSSDNQNFTKIATVEDGTNLQNRYDSIVLRKMASGRYVKIEGTSRTTDYGYSIFDIAIYGTTNTDVNETTQAPTTKAPVTTPAPPTTNPPTTKPPTTKPPTTKPPVTAKPGTDFSDEGVSPSVNENQKPEQQATSNTGNSNQNTTNQTVDANTSGNNHTEQSATTVDKENENVAQAKAAKAKVKRAVKKSSNKIKISLKKIKKAKKYQIQLSKTKKFKKKLLKKTVKKVKVTIRSNKIKKVHRVYIRVRAVFVLDGKKYYSSWSKGKKMK